MLRAFTLSLQSLSDRRILAVLFKSLALTLLAFVALGIVTWIGLGWIIDRYVTGPDGIAALIAFIVILLAGWLLWRGVAIAAIWFFSDDIVDAVEQQHYPSFAEMGTRPGAMQSAKMALRSVGRAVGYNLLASPVYLLLLFTAIGTPIAFILVNGQLLGKDLEDMLAARHNAPNGRHHVAFAKGPRFLLGVAGTAAMLVPFVNFLVPVVATAMAVHMAHLKQN
jgi:CysZ protein